MALFEVHTENRQEDLIWNDSIPASFQGQIFTHKDAAILTGDFGIMTFQHALRPKYSIWLNDYQIKSDRMFTARADIATQELHMLLANNVLYRLTSIGELAVRETQFNITYTPFLENKIRLYRGAHYTTFDIHFQRSYFEKMAIEYPDELLPFLEKIDSGHSATFYPHHQYATQLMLYAARKILQVLSGEYPDTLKLDLLVELLFIEAITCRGGVNTPRQAIRAGERDAIHHISTMILSDTSEIKTIHELAREAQMNSKKLKYLFKQENGMGIYQYWQLARLEKSREMLITSPALSLHEIAHMFGFSDVHSYGKAFKKRYNNPPSHFRK